MCRRHLDGCKKVAHNFIKSPYENQEISLNHHVVKNQDCFICIWLISDFLLCCVVCVVLTILSRFDLKIEETISNILNQRSEKQVTIVIQSCDKR
jgi:hypothetical protein